MKNETNIRVQSELWPSHAAPKGAGWKVHLSNDEFTLWYRIVKLAHPQIPKDKEILSILRHKDHWINPDLPPTKAQLEAQLPIPPVLQRTDGWESCEGDLGLCGKGKTKT